MRQGNFKKAHAQFLREVIERHPENSINNKKKFMIACADSKLDVHHMTPKALKGHNNRENLVGLTREEHAKLHILLMMSILQKQQSRKLAVKGCGIDPKSDATIFDDPILSRMRFIVNGSEVTMKFAIKIIKLASNNQWSPLKCFWRLFWASFHHGCVFGFRIHPTFNLSWK